MEFKLLTDRIMYIFKTVNELGSIRHKIFMKLYWFAG